MFYYHALKALVESTSYEYSLFPYRLIAQVSELLATYWRHYLPALCVSLLYYQYTYPLFHPIFSVYSSLLSHSVLPNLSLP
jgi:hypothetical protein